MRLVLPLFIATQAFSAVSPPPLPAATTRTEPGLVLTLAAGGRTDTRGARMVALYVPKGQPVSPFLPPGPFTAKWTGSIVMPLRGEATFSATVRGAMKATLNGQLILEGAGDSTAQTVNKTVPLTKGANAIVVEFSADGSADAQLQLHWWSREFPAEPVPPMVFQRDAADPALRTGERLRAGRLLFAQLRCIQCHDAAGLVPPPGEGMPELAQSAPALADWGAKFREDFLAHWIHDPHAIRPHALMPRMFADNGQSAADIAAFFAAQAQPDDAAPAAENAPLGGALFANFGCIACHTPPDFEGEDEHARVPLSHVKAKWHPRALTAFLKDPARDYPHIRMPHFRLSDEEAERLTSYLLENAKREFPPAPRGDATRGGQLFATAGCITCHAGAPAQGTSRLTDTLAGGWQKGCVAPDASARGKAPDFALTPAQRDALVAFAAAGFDSLRQDVPLEVAERQVRDLRCDACHGMDGHPSKWTQLEGDMLVLQSGAPSSDDEHAPKPSTALPALTWLGEKLHPAWMETFIAGKGSDKPRPWLFGRMPGFATWARSLAHGLPQAHGFPLASEPVKVDPTRAAIGERLIGENGGFNCVQCHGVGERAATAVFEAPGPNLALTPPRIRHEFYARWLLAPLRIDPETKMPKFADEEGRTPLTDVCDGKAADQFDAIWHYLHSLKSPPPPSK